MAKRRVTPGCLVRSTLAVFGVVFVPMAIWFAHRRHWLEALVLAIVSVLFLRWAFDRSEDSLLTAIDDLDV